jgi:putative ABC transport system permease protein
VGARKDYRQVRAVLSRDFVISGRNVLRHARRSAAGAFAVAFGAAALVLAAGFIEWIYWAMREGAIHSGLGHLQVVRTGYLERGAADPFRYLLPESSPEKALIERLPNVVSVAPRLRFTGLVAKGDSSLSFLGHGVDTAREVDGAHATFVEAGAALSNDDPSGVALGQGLAASLEARVGDKLVLLVTRRGGVLDGMDVTVRGIFSTPTKAYDDVAVHVPFRLANELLQAGGAHAWVVYLDSTGSTGAVVDRLKRELGATFEVMPWYQAADFYQKTVRLFSRQVLVMKLIIALVVVLAISNTMMMSVLERTNEIATSMALGLRRRRVLVRFIFEGLFVGLIGGALGVAAGCLLAAGISHVGIPMPPPPGMARSYVGEILITPALAVDALVIAVLTALVASVLPAVKASRMVIAEALRHGR